MNTYCMGYILKATKHITKKDFVFLLHILHILQYEFNNYHNTNEFEF